MTADPNRGEGSDVQFGLTLPLGRPHTRCVGLSGSTTREHEAWKKSALASSHGGRVCR